MFGNYLSKFWQNPIVVTYFDEVQITLPPMYKSIMKQVQIGDGQYETRSERQLMNAPGVLVAQYFLPNLKTAKVMRIDYGEGIGPIFELGDIKDKIETLESQCAPKDSHK